MLTCPQCHQPIDLQAVTCPYCRTTLKAFGHPGMPLYRAEGEEYLCDRCTYHEDNTCTFPQRPHAKTCTLFQDRFVPLEPETAFRYRGGSGLGAVKAWCWRNRGWLLLLGLIAFSLIWALG